MSYLVVNERKTLLAKITSRILEEECKEVNDLDLKLTFWQKKVLVLSAAGPFPGPLGMLSS